MAGLMQKMMLMLLLGAGVLSPVLAQDAEPKDYSIAEATALNLPNVSQDGFSGLLINDQNVVQYKTIIVPELYRLVRAGQLQLNAAGSLHYVWRLDDEWVRNSLQPEKELFAANSLARPQIAARRGYVYGVKAQIAEESDASRAAQKILWNVVSTLWGQKILDIDFSLSWLRDNQAAEKLSGGLRRVYTASLGSLDKTGQVFREIVRFKGPAAIAGLAFLTFRFFGEDEDVVWLYSPAIKKSRELTGSNRSDSILRSALSLDDFFTWSGKPEAVQPVLERSVIALVAFGSLEISQAVIAADNPVCLDVKGQFKSAAQSAAFGTSRWGVVGKDDPSLQILFPAGTIFVPRELWQLELTSQDPFSLYGRQILYVDSEMMLPVYKVVFNRAGNLWKIVISSFGLAVTADNLRKAPFPLFTLVVDVLTRESLLLDYSRVRYCSALHETIKLSDFDPRRLGE